MDAKEIIGQLENSTGILPLTLCLEASDLQKPGFGVDCLHRWAKEGEKRVREKTLIPISFLPSTLTRKTLITTKGLSLKGVPGDQGGVCTGVLCFTGKHVLGMVFA